MHPLLRMTSSAAPPLCGAARGPARSGLAAQRLVKVAVGGPLRGQPRDGVERVLTQQPSLACRRGQDEAVLGRALGVAVGLRRRGAMRCETVLGPKRSRELLGFLLRWGVVSVPSTAAAARTRGLTRRTAGLPWLGSLDG